MTIRWRIILTMAAALVAAIVIGITGLVALDNTQSSLEGIYRTSLIPIVHVSEVRASLMNERNAVNRAIARAPARVVVDKRLDDETSDVAETALIILEHEPGR